jgi:hypothetical protein
MNVAIRIEAVADPAGAQALIEHWVRSLDGARAAVLYPAGWPQPKLPASVEAVPLWPGCPCCTSALALRVTLVRVVHRLKPTQVLLLLTQTDHVSRLGRQIQSGELGAGLQLI